ACGGFGQTGLRHGPGARSWLGQGGAQAAVMKIAYFSPLPPQRTGIADYSKELLPALVKCGVEADLWVDQPARAAELPDCRIRNYAGEPGLRAELSKYDSVIYHMGNSPAHRNIYRTLLETPGVVVLHDFVLHHFFASYYLE